MTVKLANKVVAWLDSLNSDKSTFDDIVPVSVTIGKETFFGARYKVGHDITQPLSTRFYLVGDLPESYKKRSRTSFLFDGSQSDWYIAGFYSQAWHRKNGYLGNPNHDVCHPFGDWFGIHEWTAPGNIDEHEPYIYKRIGVTLQLLDTN